MFRARLRRIGSSLGFLVPKQELVRLEAKEGDKVEVAIFRPARSKGFRLEDLVGLLPGGPAFEREREDRF